MPSARKPQWNANKEPTVLTNRLSCFFIPGVIFTFFKTWCYPNFPPFELLSWQLLSVIHLFVCFAFADNRLKRNTEEKVWSLTPCLSLALVSLTVNDNQWDSSPGSMQREEDWLLFLFEIHSNKFPHSFSSHNMFTYFKRWRGVIGTNAMCLIWESLIWLIAVSG